MLPIRPSRHGGHCGLHRAADQPAAGALSHAREQIHALAGQAAVEVTVSWLNTSIRTVITEGMAVEQEATGVNLFAVLSG